MLVRGKELDLGRHAAGGMLAERPPISLEDVIHALEEPNHDDGSTATKRIGKRTIIVRYEESEVDVFVRSVSATHRHLAPKMPGARRRADRHG